RWCGVIRRTRKGNAYFLPIRPAPGESPRAHGRTLAPEFSGRVSPSRIFPAQPHPPPGESMLHAASVFLVLYAFWLLLSGLFTPVLLAGGAGCALAVLAFARRMDVIDREGHPIHLGWRALFSYWPWLIKEIAKSSWDVSRRILDPRLPISPTLA